MKKYIIAILGMAFTLQLTAQKVLVIHKKDGTVIEVPVTSKISFSGKAVVNDGEYTQIEVESITETVGKQPQANISINIKGCQLQGNFTPDSYGCIYGTTPGLTIDNGTVVSGTVIPFEYYKTYYFRSFVKYRGETYYSEEVSAEVLPAMEWYGIYADAEYYGQSGYVHPIDEAVNVLLTKYPNVFVSKYEGALESYFLKLWHKYLTTDKVKELATVCKEKCECKECTVYLLDEIGDDFMTVFAENVNVGLDISDLLVDANVYSRDFSKIDTVKCDPSLDIPNNIYYEFVAKGNFAMPTAVYCINEVLTPGKTYEVEIVTAPASKPSLLVINHLNGWFDNKKFDSNELYYDYETKTDGCDVIKLTFSPKQLGDNAIEISSQGFFDTDAYDMNLRIASVKIREVK